MGVVVKRIRFEARNRTEAQRYAERTIPGANALPGSGPKAAGRAQVIGIKSIPQ